MQRPRPVLTTSAVAGAVTGVALILGFLGFSDASAHLSAEAQVIGSMVALVVGTGGHLIAALVSQEKVTPLSDPRDAHGNPLVKYEPLLGKAVSVASTLDSGLAQVDPALHQRLDGFLADLRADINPLLARIEDLATPIYYFHTDELASVGKHAAPEVPTEAHDVAADPNGAMAALRDATPTGAASLASVPPSVAAAFGAGPAVPPAAAPDPSVPPAQI